MKAIALTLTGLCAAILLSAQPCGTLPPPQPEMNITYEKEAYVDAPGVNRHDWKRAVKGRNSVFVVQFYLVYPDESPKAMMLDEIENAVANMNQHFSPAGVFFRQEKDAIEIKYADLASFDMPDDEKELSTFKHKGKKIHIFLIGSIQGAKNNGSIDGYTYNAYDGQVKPYQEDMLIVSMGKVSDGSTLSHEMGHFFGLKHTHEFSGTGRGEYVERHRCKELGDCMCDTPADPGLFAWVDNNGNFTGAQKDKEGNEYRPMVDNLMSYAPARFRHQFTPGQLRKIEQTALFKRQYLITGTTTEKGAVAPYVADLTLAGAYEQFQLGGPDKVLLLIQKDSAMWSSRMTRELSSLVQHDSRYANLIDKGERFTLLLYNADQPDNIIPDFIGNNVFKQPNEIATKEYEWLSTVLRQEMVEFPGLIVLEFTDKQEFSYQIAGFYPGYWKPDEVPGLIRLYGELLGFQPEKTR